MKLSKKQELFLEELDKGNNIFLTGKAGTGKSTAIKEGISLLQKKGKKVVALAPTGIAANNIGGQTIHSMFNIIPFGVSSFETCNFLKSEKRKLIDSLDTIFIDEISMLRPDILDAMNWTMLKNGCKSLASKQLVFIGDMKQLPAPIDDNMRSVLYRTYDGVEFYYAQVYKKMNPMDIELDEVLRQSDIEFINNLNLVREGVKSEYFRRFLNNEPAGIVLAPHNATVKQYNEEGLAAIKSEEFVFEAKVEGNIKADDFNLESIVRVKNGCKIMYLANSKNNNLVNGTLGIFVSYKDCHYIRVGKTDYALEKMEFTKKEYVLNKDNDELELKTLGSITQYPIKLACALSIHKSQGLTFDEVTVDLRRPCFQPGQMYVALSRARSPEGLRIIAEI